MIVGFPSAVKRFSSEVTVFDDNKIVIMTGGGFDTEDETDFEALNLKLNTKDNVDNKGNNIFEIVKLSMHCASSSGLSY